MRSLIGVTVLGLVFRLLAVSVPRMHIDEGWSYYLCRNTLPQVMHHLLHDRHPPLSYLLLFVWMRLAGTEEGVMRLPWALLSTLNVPLTFLLARRVFSERSALLAALLVAVAYPCWEFETAMRSYLFLTLFGLGSTWLLVELRRDGRSAVAVGYAASLAVGFYGPNPLALIWLSHVVVELLRPRQRRLVVRCWLAAAAACLPLVPYLASQMASQPATAETAQPVMAARAITLFLPRASGLDHLPYLQRTPEGAPALMDVAVSYRLESLLLGALLLAAALRAWQPKTDGIVVIVTLVLPAVVLLAAIPYHSLLGQPRFYAFLTPFVSILLAAPRPGVGGRVLAIVCVGVMLAVNSLVVSDYLRSAFFRAGDWKTAAAWVRSHSTSGQWIVGLDGYCMHAFNFYYCGDKCHYDVSDHPTYRFDDDYATHGGLPQLRLWPQEVPHPAAEELQAASALHLILWSAPPQQREWFSSAYRVSDSLVLSTQQPEGNVEIYQCLKTPPGAGQ